MTTFTMSPYTSDQALSDEGMVGIVVLTVVIAVFLGSLLFYITNVFEKPVVGGGNTANLEITAPTSVSSLPH